MVKSSLPQRPIQFIADVEEVRRCLIAAMRRVCPPSIADEAEDLVQRAMIKLMKSQGEVEGRPAVSASYLWRVAYTAVIDDDSTPRSPPGGSLDRRHRRCDSSRLAARP